MGVDRFVDKGRAFRVFFMVPGLELWRGDA